jgi:spore maturation protein CgeB
MLETGWCPSGRLFEAAACGAAILTDRWAGLEAFFRPGPGPDAEVLVASTTEEALAALDLPAGALRAVGARARARALECHTAAHRAAELELLLSADLGELEAADPAAVDVEDDEESGGGRREVA